MKRVFFSIILLATVLFFAIAEAAWQEEWERVLAAAKKEGTVTMTGPGGTVARDILTGPFTKKYGISVEFLGGSGRVISPRVLTERRARVFLWDIYVGGSTTALTNLIPAGAFDPLDPTFILPEVKDPKSWRGGAMEILDRRRLFIMTPSQRATIYVNTNMVKMDELKSYKDLLDPKWKGKIVIDDPRKPGPGMATFVFLSLHPELGMDYIRALARQEPFILKDYRQEVNFVAQGRYPILLGGWNVPAEDLIKKGLPIAIVNPGQLREGSDLSAVTGALGLYNKAPHPHAARVYINWLLSKEGQTMFAKAMNYISARVDVPTDHSPWRVPKKGAIKSYTPEAMKVKSKLVPKLQKVFGH